MQLLWSNFHKFLRLNEITEEDNFHRKTDQNVIVIFAIVDVTEDHGVKFLVPFT